MSSGWDVKALIKQIVMSKVYRQASNISEELFKKDPENRLLVRGSRFRMDAEMIRDQIFSLAAPYLKKCMERVSSLLNSMGFWKAVTVIGERFKPDSGEEIRRRSIYTYWKRGMPPPQMTILNAPIRDACVSRRERTNTPSQALLLLNESEYLKAARNLAMTVLVPKDAKPIQRIAFAYETITSKLPDKEEQKTV